MPNLNPNKTVQNIREFLDVAITNEVALYYLSEDQELPTKLYNVKCIWGGDTYYVVYTTEDSSTVQLFLPINATTISKFSLQ